MQYDYCDDYSIDQRVIRGELSTGKENVGNDCELMMPASKCQSDQFDQTESFLPIELTDRVDQTCFAEAIL